MSLNVIGLISGGKDSLYSLAHCVQNGHKIVALANLHPIEKADSPAGKEDEDLNSFMYQTVGYSAIPLYAGALNLPLYRRVITGSALQKGKDYEAVTAQTDNHEQKYNEQMDEAEDMYVLIQDILKQHPEANALNAGAILSTYQRTRVESVATRLGLLPLAYLWQYPGLPPPSTRKDSLTGLLDDMSTAGCDARIIKLASGGIRSDILFTNVASQACRSKLVNGLVRFYTEPGQGFELRGAVLGEGGEYESLALDGPGNLWTRRIDADLEGTFERDGVTYAQFHNLKTIEKESNVQSNIPVPALLDERFSAVLRAFGQAAVTPTAIQLTSTSEPRSLAVLPTFQVSRTGNTLQISNLTAAGATATEQFTNILDELSNPSTLQYSQAESQLSLENIVSTTLLLDRIDCFLDVNRVYSTKLWPSNRAIPPARVTIATCLPPGVQVALSLIFDASSSIPDRLARSRDGLHVQSRSYWAPANIGPYSQAVSAPLFPSHLSRENTSSAATFKIVHMAGQIPLSPSSMRLSDGTFAEQAVLALQHLWRVGQERNVDCWTGAGVAYLGAILEPAQTMPSRDSQSVYNRVQEAAALWQLSHILDEKGKERWPPDNSQSDRSSDGEEEEVDVWHLQRNRGLPSKISLGEHLYALPCRDFSSAANGFVYNHDKSGLLCQKQEALLLPTPAFIAAEVVELPRHASIEWWSSGISGLVQENLRKNVILYGFHRALGTGCIAKGILLQHSEPRDFDHVSEVSGNDREDDRDASLGQDTFSLFWTLLLDIDVDQAQIAQILAEPVQALLQTFYTDTVPGTHDVSASHTFLNTFAPAVLQNAVTGSEIVAKSTIVPCKHVWTSDDIQQYQERPALPAIRELVAAIILRIDVR